MSSAKYSVIINGEVSGHFKGNKELKQVDPVSPYLFTTTIELLSSLLKEGWLKKLYKPHPRCKRVELSNISFTDDIIVFYRGEEQSIKEIMDIIKNFS